jgi:long-chain acyl-CoA synthetase
MHQRIRRGIEREKGLKRRLFEQAVTLGKMRLAGERPGLGGRLLEPLLEKLVRNKVRARFGGRLKAMVSGGAPLNPEIGSFFLALGVQLLQGYGQTEAAPVIATRLVRSKSIQSGRRCAGSRSRSPKTAKSSSPATTS